MNWSSLAWKEAEPAYKQILNLAFIHELMDGSLDRSKFMFYIRQDALYLSGFGKALCGIAARLGNPEHSAAFIGFAGDTIAVERELHQVFLKDELDAQGRLRGAEPSPTCLLYTSYMLRQLYDVPLEVAMASVLPCFWVYKEVGDYILANQKRGSNQYQDWIDTYGGEEYGGAVKKAIAVCDEMAAACTAERRAEMTAAYVMCTKMEWMFWESAYRLEGWPV
ncbi:TenA family protein [Desulfovibrio sp. OttesenSCG-928-C14]|nr:TenA family protein [Desulfovibrio sp. OttesenSCG-928-C14]